MASTASRTFQRQVSEKKSEKTRPTAEFTLAWMDDEDSEKVIRSDTFHATQPSDEKLFMLAALAGDEDGSASADAAATLGIFRESLPPDEYRVLKERMKDDEDPAVSLDVLSEVVPWLMEEWSSFPTEPSSGSSASPGSTGTKSTGRVRGPGSTRSA